MLTPFADLPLHPLLARAIAKRGYETATSVQAEVLDPAASGRDLLVSSQTGSGKTLAFGSLIAGAVLGDAPDAVAPRAMAGKGPRALIVAPTRELAAQVGRELEWLFADARAAIGTFTGGTAITGDFRVLHRGVHIAVGTPGRLVDLHERKALDLSNLAALVLDEADEMLDLGFKDDLEFLLSKSPPERRTLLFSATLPREIEQLAKKYQRDALRIDPRAQNTNTVHNDITYVGYLVRPEDRLAAVVNVLLMGGEGKAIVFCRTRDRVGDLHQRLVDFGFRAEAIAGDRAQSERDRALAALRDGRAQVLVATDVAARGLDLPDLECVIHGDLPDSVDTLTHRSGRTGRAGRKGLSVVISDLREQRRAERLLSGAGIRGQWSDAPGLDEVRAQAEDRLLRTLVEAVGARAEKPERAPKHLGALGDRLREAIPEEALLDLLLARELVRLNPGLPLARVVGPAPAPARPRAAAKPHAPVVRPAPAEAAPASATRERKKPAPAVAEAKATPHKPAASHTAHKAPAHVPHKPASDTPHKAITQHKPVPALAEHVLHKSTPASGAPVIFRVSLGRETNADARVVLEAITRRGGVGRNEIGAIRIGPASSTFEVAANAATRFAQAVRHPDPEAPKVRFQPVQRTSPGDKKKAKEVAKPHR